MHLWRLSAWSNTLWDYLKRSLHTISFNSLSDTESMLRTIWNTVTFSCSSDWFPSAEQYPRQWLTMTCWSRCCSRSHCTNWWPGEPCVVGKQAFDHKTKVSNIYIISPTWLVSRCPYVQHRKSKSTLTKGKARFYSRWVAGLGIWCQHKMWSFSSPTVQ